MGTNVIVQLQNIIKPQIGRVKSRKTRTNTDRYLQYQITRADDTSIKLIARKFYYRYVYIQIAIIFIIMASKM